MSFGSRWRRADRARVDLSPGCQSRRRRQGGLVPPPSVLAPETALGSVPTVALSSAQVRVVVGAWLRGAIDGPWGTYRASELPCVQRRGKPQTKAWRTLT